MKRHKNFIVNEYEIKSYLLPKAFDGTRIAMLSDFHNNSYGVDADKVLEEVRRQKPDFVVIAGDMYSGEPGLDNLKARDFMEKISRDNTVYYGLGNHEYRMMLYPGTYKGMYEDFMDMVKKTGVILLKNETVSVKKEDSEILITGLMIDRSYYSKYKKKRMQENYVESIAGRRKTDKFNILIAHNPVYFKNYAQWGADLVFSGHMHGGMARLPLVGGVISPSYGLFPKYDMGVFTQGNSTMVLSAGIGTHTINIRPFNPPELVMVKLTCNKE